jgi:3-isopropylmalate dehydrogenase
MTDNRVATPPRSGGLPAAGVPSSENDAGRLVSRSSDVSAPDTAFHIAVLPGDGIGVDVTREAVRVLRAVESRLTGVRFVLQEHSVGAGEYLRSGNPLTAAALDGCAKADAVLLGAMGLPSVRWPDGREMTPQIDLREMLDLYAGPRPIKLYHANDTPLKGYGSGGFPAAELETEGRLSSRPVVEEATPAAGKPPLRTIDFVIVRENTEGLFSARLSTNPSDDEARDVLRLTRRGCERVIRFAFELARKRRRHCTLVDKANVLPSMVFLRRIFDEVAAQYPDVQTDRVYVDAMALFLVRKPEAFDVIVTENMFGDILSDLAGGLVGGMGMAPSGDIGDDCAVFQPSHGTAPDIAGKGIANPVATILSAAMMLEWLGHEQTMRGAKRIEAAVQRVFADPTNRTPDMGGKLTTSELTDLIIAAL